MAAKTLGEWCREVMLTSANGQPAKATRTAMSSMCSWPRWWPLGAILLNVLFKQATGNSLRSSTMRDREFVNRFCAFQILSPAAYREKNMDEFLGLLHVQRCQLLQLPESAALTFSSPVFGSVPGWPQIRLTEFATQDTPPSSSVVIDRAP